MTRSNNQPVVYLCRVPLYHTAVLFVGDCDSRTAVDRIYHHRKLMTRVLIPDTSSACVIGSGGDVFMWIQDMEWGSTMFHELFHCAVEILRSRGIPLNDSTEEAVAYLLGWLKINLMDKVYDKRDVLIKKQKELKK